MRWVLIYLAIAVAGLILVGCFAWWLWRKTLDLGRELGGLLERVGEAAGLLDEIGQPAASDGPRRGHGSVDDPDAEKDGIEVGSPRRRAT